jgi:hypothetical protein
MPRCVVSVRLHTAVTQFYGTSGSTFRIPVVGDKFETAKPYVLYDTRVYGGLNETGLRSKSLHFNACPRE